MEEEISTGKKRDGLAPEEFGKMGRPRITMCEQEVIRNHRQCA